MPCGCYEASFSVLAGKTTLAFTASTSELRDGCWCNQNTTDGGNDPFTPRSPYAWPRDVRSYMDSRKLREGHMDVMPATASCLTRIPAPGETSCHAQDSRAGCQYWQGLVGLLYMGTIDALRMHGARQDYDACRMMLHRRRRRFRESYRRVVPVRPVHSVSAANWESSCGLEGTGVKVVPSSTAWRGDDAPQSAAMWCRRIDPPVLPPAESRDAARVGPSPRAGKGWGGSRRSPRSRLRRGDGWAK